MPPSEESKDFLAKVDTFTKRLDAKVHIDKNDPKYSHIYQEMDTIVKRVAAELTKLDPFFAEVKLRQTGSIISGVNVGLPHESDYMMELPEGKKLIAGKDFNRHTLFPLVHSIVKHQAVALVEGLDGQWEIHGVEKYERIGGVCLVMQNNGIANDHISEAVGVTVDLVPVYVMKTTHQVLNENAEAFLPYTLKEY